MQINTDNAYGIMTSDFVVANFSNSGWREQYPLLESVILSAFSVLLFPKRYFLLYSSAKSDQYPIYGRDYSG
jgi:hypothetical protein